MFGFKIDKFNDVPVALASTAEHIHMRIIPHVHITRLFLFISRIIRVLRDYCKGTNKRVCPTLVIDISDFNVAPVHQSSTSYRLNHPTHNAPLAQHTLPTENDYMNSGSSAM